MRCRRSATPAAAPAPAPSAGGARPPPAPAYSGLDRADFNRGAVRANLPLYWVSDADHDGVVDPEEVASLLFYPTEGHWVQSGAFTPDFDRAWQKLKAALTLTPSNPPTADDQRRALVAQDLDQGLPTLVASDFAASSAEDRAFVGHMLTVAKRIDDLFETQNGASALRAQVAAGDDLSQSLFRRNWGPRCLAPLTEKNPLCSAIAGRLRPRPSSTRTPRPCRRTPRSA